LIQINPPLSSYGRPLPCFCQREPPAPENANFSFLTLTGQRLPNFGEGRTLSEKKNLLGGFEKNLTIHIAAFSAITLRDLLNFQEVVKQ
jgi:hypothetical protein